ncbi:DNA polymerase Y family protein [Sphingomonas sp. BIUV-7]|uniref:DNA polymerase Y family protein n=1 Tax=Sphingomonas natans TaxID=3063330 RepID=A0ABT8YDP1_9SPHN|nr:DNA polymerase Y family protein [Sphingomonas sp. BIUV-7]MDO6416467.1 DNA polymerase Y family protein [Sphingomonas sp. BIUV-7]
MTVFTEKQANAVRLTALSREALAAGLTTGLTLADARARLPGLVAIERDHTAEARLLARAVEACRAYSPVVAPAPSDGIVLDIAGCTHAYGSEDGLVADLARRLRRQGLTLRLGLGDTPEAARARARFGAGPEADLLALPVEALEASPEITLALRRAGLKRIMDLACRPRRMLAARFGDLALRLGRLLGEEDRRITPERLIDPVFGLRRFAEPIGRVEDGLACLADLLAEAGATLLERHEGGRRFVARFFRSDGAVPGLVVETGRPVRDPGIVMRLFRERLEALADPIDPGFGFDCIRLDVPVTEPLAPAQDGLGGEDRAAAPLAELVDRLVARLGADRIARVAPLDSHIPECAVAIVPAATEPHWPAPFPDDPPLRPLRLLDPPQPIEVTYGLPEGPPRRFVWQRRAHEVARWEGPERIAAEWWRRRIGAETWLRRDADDHPLPLPLCASGRTRDYYRVEDKAGHRFWLFRHGLAGGETEMPAWYVHGLFA